MTTGVVIGIYEILLSMQYCEVAHAIFPYDRRSLVTVDRLSAANLHGTTDIVACDAISLSWSDGCNENSTATTISPAGDIIRPSGGRTTLLACPRQPDNPELRGLTAAIYDLSNWRVDDHGMLILAGGGHELVFGRD